MNGDADYHAVLADLKERREGIDAAIKTVEGIIVQLGLTPGSAKIRGTQDLPADAFLTLTIPEAAIKFLGMVRSAQSVAQIWEAMKQGGLTHTKYNAVYNALFRRENQVGDVVKLPDGNWGLSEWYATSPSLKRKVKSKTVSAEPQEAKAPPKREGLTVVDATERVLREVGKPLHANVIVEKLREMGKETSAKSIAGTLPQDPKKRFKNLGKNLWVLVEK
ncbi:MAG TPA: hypothetical protein DCK93_02775 [Blastocatellia bacterium]|jgi:DNA-directed RNA polymerase delta subunit|nr:hypothetical protein [Blastocatellia bacterium]